MIRAATRQLRQRLPAPAVRLARRGLLGWGWLTADLRPSPEILVVGAQRAGTTTLFRMLSEHPQLRRPTVDKGTGYFDDGHVRGARWYRAHFPLRLRRGSTMAFECSGFYLFHPLAADRIARELPGCRVVVMVRDPVERAYSAYRHELARGYENLTFADALAAEGRRLAEDGRSPRSAHRPATFSERHHSYLRRGQYAEQIARFVDVLGPERVHVVDAGLFFDDPVESYVRLQRALGLAEHRPSDVGRWNERPGPPLAGELHRQLRAHYEEHDAALARLLGHPPSWREKP